ncbi:MAG: preprotein translocase subunit SecY [Planctomycetes bacterium]|nr:preprotein translocase subunit SecY [Planctomycetota bacterium]
MEQSFLNLLRVEDTRKKIVTTILLLLCYRLGFQVPIPGMSPDFLRTQAESGSSIFGLMSAFSGGQIGQATIFSLGIMPYISASIIFQMLSKVSPTLEAVAKEGAAGQKKINQWTRLAVVPIAILQAIFVFTGVFLRQTNMIEDSMRDNTFALGVIVVASLLAGALVVMWLGELITEHGVGNGASLIIMAGIIAKMPQALYSMSGDDGFWQVLLQIAGIWAVTVFVVVYIHKGARRVPIQYARLTRGRRVYGGQKHFLPLKINMAGVMPIIFASVIFVVPGLIFAWLEWHEAQRIFNDQTGFVYVTMYVGLVFGFCFFWNRLMFQPEEIADNLREHGSFIPGIRPGAKTAEYLTNVLTRITLAGAAFLAIIAVAPSFITKESSLPQNLRYFLGGTSVLIVVGVALELVDRLQSQMVMKSVDQASSRGAGSGWTKKERA